MEAVSDNIAREAEKAVDYFCELFGLDPFEHKTTKRKLPTHGHVKTNWIETACFENGHFVVMSVYFFEGDDQVSASLLHRGDLIEPGMVVEVTHKSLSDIYGRRVVERVVSNVYRRTSRFADGDFTLDDLDTD